MAQRIAITEFEVKRSSSSSSSGGGGGGGPWRAYCCHWKARDASVVLKEKPEEYEREVSSDRNSVCVCVCYATETSDTSDIIYFRCLKFLTLAKMNAIR